MKRVIVDDGTSTTIHELTEDSEVELDEALCLIIRTPTVETTYHPMYWRRYDIEDIDG